MPSEPSPAAEVRPWQRWTVVVLAVLAVLHTLLLVLWLSPPSPVRSAVGSDTLASYVDPYFQQSSDVVGVGAQFVDESFSIRARVRGADGSSSVTAWVDVTARDVTATRRDLDPARVHVMARRLATNLNLAMFNLDAAQRRTVSRITAADLVSQVRTRLERNGDDSRSIRSFQAYDQMATQFASLYARSWWADEEVLQVQYRVGRRTVPPFDERAATSLDDVELLTFGFGWRRAFRGSLEAREAFDAAVGR